MLIFRRARHSGGPFTGVDHENDAGGPRAVIAGGSSFAHPGKCTAASQGSFGTGGGDRHRFVHPGYARRFGDAGGGRELRGNREHGPTVESRSHQDHVRIGRRRGREQPRQLLSDRRLDDQPAQPRLALHDRRLQRSSLSGAVSPSTPAASTISPGFPMRRSAASRRSRRVVARPTAPTPWQVSSTTSLARTSKVSS